MGGSGKNWRMWSNPSFLANGLMLAAGS
jgi:hypothetical protein